MNDFIFAAIAGVVQGLTEFLPVSSSGHLLLLHDWLGFDFVDNIAFDVFMHWGTLVALLLFFRKEIFYYAAAFFASFKNWNIREDADQRIAWGIVVGTIPAALVGFFFESQIENFFRSSVLVAIMLIAVGVLLFIVDRVSKKMKEMNEIRVPSALLVGIAQAIALIPGVSRSGITIIAGLSQNLKREAAAKFAFLLSIPIVFGAGLKKMIDLLLAETLTPQDLGILLTGFFAAFLSGYFVVKFFLKYLQKHSLTVFVVYRIALGVIILLFFA